MFSTSLWVWKIQLLSQVNWIKFQLNHQAKVKDLKDWVYISILILLFSWWQGQNYILMVSLAWNWIKLKEHHLHDWVCPFWTQPRNFFKWVFHIQMAHFPTLVNSYYFTCNFKVLQGKSERKLKQFVCIVWLKKQQNFLCWLQ